MDKKNVFLFAFAIIAAALILAASGCTQTSPAQGNQTSNATKAPEQDANSDGYWLIANSFNNLALLKDYSLEVNNSMDAYDSIQTIERTGGVQHVRVATPVDVKDAYFAGNSTIFCIKVEKKPRECFEVANTSNFYPIVQGYGTFFFDDRYINGARQENTIFQSSNARTFVANLTNQTYNGFPCTQTQFVIDYKKMTVDQLNALGLTADTYQYNDNFLTTMCIDGKGIPIYLNISYREVYDNLTRSTVRTVTGFKESGFGITVPEVNSNESAFAADYTDANAALIAYAKCFRLKNDSDRDDCYKGSAFDSKNAKVCERIIDVQKHDQCVIAIMSKQVKPELCAMTSVFADDCYAEAARVTSNATYCASITNQTLQTQCIDYLKGTYQPAPQCINDAGCGTTGCSGTICAPKDNPVTTTCEWRPEYACYQENNAVCGCYFGICGWKQNDNLTACLAIKGNISSNGTGAQAPLLPP
ncbi:MAG TPA: hypothetical protein PLO51_00855, partial [Candidatus Micrarchaeota archaeon]|nr:hypothetical protein [Candidatus Micrarchaeota archaeon]